jgi:HTH-type transcriptional regulator / antitoxin HigA
MPDDDGIAILNEADYKAALMRVDALMDAEAGTPEGAELERLAAAIEAYEEEHYPIG